MSNGFLLIPIFFPVICGALFFALNPKTKKARNTFVLTSVLLNTAIMFVTIFLTNDILFTLFDFSGDLTIALNLDGRTCERSLAFYSTLCIGIHEKRRAYQDVLHLFPRLLWRYARNCLLWKHADDVFLL